MKKIVAWIAVLILAVSLLAFVAAWLTTTLYPNVHLYDRLKDAGAPGAILLVVIWIGWVLTEWPVVGRPMSRRPRRPARLLEAQESVAAEMTAKLHAEDVEATRKSLKAKAEWVVAPGSSKPKPRNSDS